MSTPTENPSPPINVVLIGVIGVSLIFIAVVIIRFMIKNKCLYLYIEDASMDVTREMDGILAGRQAFSTDFRRQSDGYYYEMTEK
jgi:hypothetical protein